MKPDHSADRSPFPASVLDDRRLHLGVLLGAGIALAGWAWLHFGGSNPGAASPAGAAAPAPSRTPASAKVQRAAFPTVEDPSWHQVAVRRGDTLSGLFARIGLPGGEWLAVLEAPGAHEVLRQLQPGTRLRYQRAADGQLQALTYPVDLTHRLLVYRTDSGYRARVQALPVTYRKRRVVGTVRESLFDAARRAGLTRRLAMQLTHIFRWEVDFKRAVRPGDYFEVIYRQLWRHGHKLRNGNIVAAQYVNRDHRYRAYRFRLPDGKTGYFKADGASVSKGIERAPLHYDFISSRFSYHRFDPVVHVWRPHYGVDYAAPIGTPVHAAADGRVVWAARDDGYGNLVVIRSFGRYKTYYAHLHRFTRGLHPGEHVRQGQVIGYVGETGEATGPHLHFGIMVNGRWRNPLTVPLPSDKPIPRQYLARFRRHIDPLHQALATLQARRREHRSPTRVAAADSPGSSD